MSVTSSTCNAKRELLNRSIEILDNHHPTVLFAVRLHVIHQALFRLYQ